MRARYLSLILAGAIVAAAAVAAVAQPRDPADAKRSRGQTPADDRSTKESVGGWEKGEPGFGVCPWGHEPRAGGRGMWRGRGGAGSGGFGFGGPGAGLLRGDGPLAERLKLSSAQREKLRGIGEQLERSAIQARADAQLARLDLARMIREDSPNRSRIESQIDTIARLRADMMKAAVRARLDAREVLTVDQRKQLDELRDSRGPRRGAGRGGWR